MIPTQKKENKQQSEIAILTMVYVVMLTASVFLLPAVFIAAYAKKQAGNSRGCEPLPLHRKRVRVISCWRDCLCHC